MYFKLVAYLILCAVLVHSQEPEIIDFTYTQLLEEANYTGRFKDQISIEPDTHQLEKYQFPEVCDLQEHLQQGADSSGTVDHFINVDDYLDKLRAKILHLLKLTEEIKNSRSYLQEISKHIDMNEEQSIEDKFKGQLQSLAKKESQLTVSKQKIQDLSALLNKKILQYNNNPKNQQFKSVSLNYDIDNYHSKINYLKDLKERSSVKAASEPHTNFTDFFVQLGFDLGNESSQIDFIDKYFQNMSHLSYLKDTANSLRDNIEVDRLNIEYKRSCAKEREDLKSKSSTLSQIKETLDHLREKKKEFGNTTNKYCQGVALKLQMQIKRLLRAINWTYMCADGLQELILKRQTQIKQLREIEDKIKNFGSGGLDAYQDEYQKTQGLIQDKFSKIKDFTIDQYTHDPIYIDQLIIQAKREKKEAEEKLKNLPQQVNNDDAFDAIKNLAEQLKKQKARFCHSYGPYETEQRKLWFQVYSHEQMQTYSSKMRGEFISESRKLQQFEKEYKQLTEVVKQVIVDNYKQK